MKHLLLLILLSGFASNATSSSKTPGKVIAGWIEKIDVEQQQIEVKAKLDTGAKTSSIYAENIEQFKKNGKRWVRFTLRLKDAKKKAHTITLEKPRSRRVKIINHDGDHDSRVSVDLDICFDGRHHTTEFTLSDRNEYIYGILLGRNFLDGVAIVDPDETFRTLSKCN